jgi:hypothetical protein
MQEFGPFFGLFTFPQVGQDWNSKFGKSIIEPLKLMPTDFTPYLAPASMILLSTS